MTKLIGYESNNRVEVLKDKDYPEAMRLDPKLEPILDTFMVDKPLWTFQATVRPPRGSEFLRQVNILKDGEVLGYVRAGYVGGKDKYLVGNERIDKQMSRRSYYSTSDVGKAISKVKKTFSAQTVAEILAKAEREVSEAMYDTRQKKWYEYTHSKGKVDKAAIEFVEGVGRDAFREFIQVRDPQVAEHLDKKETAYQEYSHMQEIEKANQDEKAYIVSRRDSVYNVKQGDNIVRYTDTDLPEFMRGKLGLLKLVDDRTYITGCGFRVNEGTFVVLPEENEE